MSSASFTLRLGDADERKLAAFANALDLTRSDVIRLAIQRLTSDEQQLERLHYMREELLAANARLIAEQTTRIRRTSLLLLKVLNAPHEAEDALQKIFE